MVQVDNAQRDLLVADGKTAGDLAKVDHSNRLHWNSLVKS
jgi:hypothetical protein